MIIAGDGGAARLGLLAASGEPVRPDRLTTVLLLEEAIRPDGQPLFPHAPARPHWSVSGSTIPSRRGR